MTANDRLDALEARVTALEAALGGAPSAAADESPAGGGVIGYRGDVTLHGQVNWHIDYSAGAVAAFPAERIAAVLGALGHPARIEIVQDLLRGPRTTTELLERVDAGSKGQLYHHLNALTAAGVVEKHTRGRYSIPPTGVVPILIAMLAAGDIDGLLR